MKEEQTDNELIAEFMGAVESRDSGICGIRTYWINEKDPNPTESRDMYYSVSWDWLMPVVPVFKEKTKHTNMPHHLFMNVVAFTVDRPLHELYENIVKGIKWYNEQSNERRR